MSINADDWIARSTIDPAVLERWPDCRVILVAAEHVDTAVELLPQIEPYAGCFADSRGTVWCTVDFARRLSPHSPRSGPS